VLSITIRYAMTVVPGLFYGAILWWAKKESEVESSQIPSPKFQRFWVVCICLSLFFTFTSNPNRTFYFLVPDSVQPWVYVPAHQQWQHVSQMRPLLAKIPDDASVAATTYIIPHLSSRRAILRFPRMQFRNDAREVEKVEYIIVDLWRLNRYRVAFKSDRQRLEKIVPRIEELYNSGEYGITGFRDGVVLMEKGVVSNLDAVGGWENFEEGVRRQESGDRMKKEEEGVQ
ncbi:MAG: DUF2079 domain-containing protein, partial [Okeania sp. SIO2D1]|nr:DUF2079 domain-containing protein [Okeania sp. SIO2D1]